MGEASREGDESPMSEGPDAYQIVMLQAEAVKRGCLTMWTVYERPTDYPSGYVARMFEISGPEPKPTALTLKSIHLEPIRDKLSRAGLVALARSAEDEPQIVECWL
jgi:hypothetical protein